MAGLRLGVLALALAAPLCLAGGGGERVDPAPVAVPAGVSLDQVARIIERSAIRRDWNVVERKPGATVLSQERREYSVTVEVDYDAASVRVRYVTSSGQSYLEEEGLAQPNTTYNRWTRNLATDIAVAMVDAPAH